MTLALAILAVAAASPAATPTPATLSPTAASSPMPAPSPSASWPGAPTVAASPPTPRRTSVPTTPRATPTPAADPTAIESSGDPADDASAGDAPSAFAVPTAAPVAPVRAFRTPEREAPPAFVAPQPDIPADPDATLPDPAAAETMPPPDEPYTATVTFRVTAATDIDGFELFVIYPRSAGDFVGSRNGVECRKTGDGTMFADDSDGGTLTVLVASNQPLAFPFDIVCPFTVEPNAVLTSRLIAVNVADATIAGARAESSALSVAVIAR